MHKQKCFWIQTWHVSNIAKVRSAWLPPRHRSITMHSFQTCTPFKAREIWKLLYQANLHGICTRATTTMDRMLVSNYFEAIGKSFLRKFHLLVECESIELNDPRSTSSNRPHLPAGIKSQHTKVKHLPRFIFYRAVIEGALEVRHAIDLAVLFADHEWHARSLLCSFRCRSWARGFLRPGLVPCWPSSQAFGAAVDGG